VGVVVDVKKPFLERLTVGWSKFHTVKSDRILGRKSLPVTNKVAAEFLIYSKASVSYGFCYNRRNLEEN
jgi:hypothetical protein